MKITIKRVENGYYMESDNEEGIKEFLVFEEREKEAEIYCVRDMFYRIIDTFGVAGGRHDKERLYVDIKPGDKYEQPSDGAKDTY